MCVCVCVCVCVCFLCVSSIFQLSIYYSAKDMISILLSVSHLSPLPSPEPPTIVIAPPDTEVDINATVLFTCVAFGNPTPNISWYMNHNVLSNESDVIIFMDTLTVYGVYFVRSTLQLCGVDVSDEAEYTCVAVNEVGYNSSSFYLDILGELGVDS